MPLSAKLSAWWTSTLRTRMSTASPVALSASTSPAPRSMPRPVSASPPSWRIPISTLGVRAIRLAIVMLCEPSSAVRSRLTPVVVESRLPPGPLAAFLRIPTHSVSALNVRPKPSPPPGSARGPPAAIAIDSALLGWVAGGYGVAGGFADCSGARGVISDGTGSRSPARLTG